jgi:hypothetical protein
MAVVAAAALGDEPPLSIATFNVDATPPLGAPLCDALVRPASKIDDRLTARGVVLFGGGRPIVLCAVDWVGIGNGGHDAWREALAKAAGTVPDRVAVHCLHQHDAPGCDFSAEELAAARSLGGRLFDVEHARRTIADVARAIEQAAAAKQPVTHVGFGQAAVERVASNRRILGPDGKVQYVRYSSSRIPEAVAAPEGVIDPLVRVLSFWRDERPLAAISFYATHPQSYYGQGAVSADFVGLARASRERAMPEVFHAHFNGAGGNVAAGKYNDGSPENRPKLAKRLAAGMEAAWKATRKTPLRAADVGWAVKGVVLPAAPALDEEGLLAVLDGADKPALERLRAARDLAFLRRTKAQRAIPLACLRLGEGRVLFMPGELFVEYQLAAQALRPDAFVAMAAYGDYGPGYIGTEIAYSQGGYETSPVSRVAPRVELVLTRAMQELMK